MDDAAKIMRYEIWRAFALGGPGWKPLSAETVGKKIKSGAPDPTAILKEFRVMVKSIDIKDQSTSKRRTFGKATFWRPSAPYTAINHVRSIGLFKDTAGRYDPKKEIGFRQDPLDVVSRGFKHEFGGFEYQVKRNTGQDVVEIRTGGLEKKALRGEGVVAEDKHLKAGIKEKKHISDQITRTGKSKIRQAIAKVRKVLQKIKKGKTTTESQIVYIPERSFLRMPFDRSVDKIVNAISNGIGRSIDALW